MAANKPENLQRLDDIAGDAEGLSILVRPIDGAPHARFSIVWGRWGAMATHYGDKYFYQQYPTVSEAIEGALQARPVDRLDFDTLEVSTRKSPIKAPKVRPVVVKALHEALGLPVPSDEELAAAAKAKKSKRQAQSSGRKKARAEILAELRGGPDGIARFNRRKRADVLELGPYQRLSFAGGDLSDANLANLSLRGCDFSKARLCGATLRNADLSKAVFDGADLSRANLDAATLTGASMVDAVLDLANIKNAKIDEETAFPSGFDTAAANLAWWGSGPDPRVLAELEKRQTESGPIDLQGFMDALHKNVDPKRLKKALKMLKADRFELFSDVGGDHVVGVIKSQTDESLVYAATLTSSGGFACCTQNLNSCGGLRGALCKHILVLIIGLTSSGSLDANAVNLWVEKSKLQYPELDKDSMSEVFLRYKGAEAGEVDWRPTETTPEDYYAF